jgi:hypothetical protein
VLDAGEGEYVVPVCPPTALSLEQVEELPDIH